jgi:hypothetical protein
MELLVQNRHLNNYTFVVRFPGCISIKNSQDVYDAQQAILYLMRLGAHFVIITHDNFAETSNKVNQIFGFTSTSNTHLYLTKNTTDGMLATMQKIRRRGQAIHTGKQLIYLDNYPPFVNMAKIQGFDAYIISKLTKESITSISTALQRANIS